MLKDNILQKGCQDGEEGYKQYRPQTARAPCTKNSLVTIVDFLRPRSKYPAGICAGQLICTGDNFSTRDNRRSDRRVTAALDPCSNSVKCGLQAYSESVRSSTTSLVLLSQTLTHSRKRSNSARQQWTLLFSRLLSMQCESSHT